MAANNQMPVEMEVGIIGMGDMGKMYARRLSAAGWSINVCDLPTRYESLQKEFAAMDKICVFQDGHGVSRRSDFIIYSVEAGAIDAVVKQFAPSTKVGAIVGGQTSVKDPEITAFEKHLPEDTYIISCHSLHGPSVDPKGQPLILIQHRGPDWALKRVEKVLECLQSRFIHLSYQEHDAMTADTQAVTHAAFLSMGNAWKSNDQFPWASSRYIGGIDNVKANIMLRIYSNKWHVYAGLAILNPSARNQVYQYSRSASSLFKLMIAEEAEEFKRRVRQAGARVFESDVQRQPILLSDKILDRFSLSIPADEQKTAKANSHLALLAMVDCWNQLGIRPYVHLDLASTPIFRLWLGIAEYLFRNKEMLEASMDAALYDKTIRRDDMEFVTATREWSQCISFGNMDLYRQRFETTSAYFAPRFEEASRIGNEMIKTIIARTET